MINTMYKIKKYTNIEKNLGCIDISFKRICILLQKDMYKYFQHERSVTKINHNTQKNNKEWEIILHTSLLLQKQRCIIKQRQFVQQKTEILKRIRRMDVIKPNVTIRRNNILIMLTNKQHNYVTYNIMKILSAI